MAQLRAPLNALERFTIVLAEFVSQSLNLAPEHAH